MNIALRKVFSLLLLVSFVVFILAVYLSYQFLEKNIRSQFAIDCNTKASQIAMILRNSLAVSDYLEVHQIVKTLDNDPSISSVEVRNVFGDTISIWGKGSTQDDDIHRALVEIKSVEQNGKKLGELSIAYKFSPIAGIIKRQFLLWSSFIIALYAIFLLAILFLSRNIENYIGDLKIQMSNVLVNKKVSLPRLGWIKEFARIKDYLENTSIQFGRMREREKQLSKYEVIGQTTGMLAHDIRKPFTQVKALLDMFDRFKENPSELEKGKKAIEKSIKNVQAMLDDITDFSREVKLETKPISLVNILDFAIRQAAHGFMDCDIRFEYMIANTYKPYADEERLARVLVNILVNAIEAITIMGKRNSGTITMSAVEKIAGERKYVEIVVGNDGPSFSADDLSQMFESFYTKGKGKGTGLGLASARKIVILHDGEIFARNRAADAGVEMVFTIPASDENETGNPDILPRNIHEIAKHEIRQDEAEPDIVIRKLLQDRRRFKILLLEDEALYRASVRNTIKRHVDLDKLITLYEAQNVDDAIKLLRHEDISHAIVDIDLNDVKDGYDFIREARAILPALPCMIHSNRSLAKDIERAKKLGTKDLVPKPLTIQDLVVFLAGVNAKDLITTDKTTACKVVLFADDDAIMRLNMEMLVREIDPKVNIYTFESGEKLLGKLHELKSCHFVFTDLHMGDGMSGLDLVKRVKEMDGNCRTYIVSNSSMSAMESEFKDVHVDGFFNAPISKGDLSKIICSYLV